ncbi:mRNA 3'-end-processing protein rna14, partial [Ceratobasidium sp. 392]
MEPDIKPHDFAASGGASQQAAAPSNSSEQQDQPYSPGASPEFKLPAEDQQVPNLQSLAEQAANALGQFQAEPATDGLQVYNQTPRTTPPTSNHPLETPEPPKPKLTETDLLRERLKRDPLDVSTRQHLIGLAEASGDVDRIQDAYEGLLEVFPDATSAQIAYLNHFLTPALFSKAELLFSRFLRTSTSPELWKFYLAYVRRTNPSTTDPQTREVVKKAYEFALLHIGHDRSAGDIWREYIDFAKAGEAKTTWEEQQKMDMLRRLYHRAVVIPLENVEQLWRELDQFENGLNKITVRCVIQFLPIFARLNSLFCDDHDLNNVFTLFEQAKKFLADLSPSYMTARTALRELRRLLDPLEQKTAPPPRDPAIPAPPDFNLPTIPTWSESDRAAIQGWKAYVKWEESNPLDLEDTAVLHNRVAGAYRKACAAMRFYPEIWYMAYNWANSSGKPDEALATLKQGMEANKS